MILIVQSYKLSLLRHTEYVPEKNKLKLKWHQVLNSLHVTYDNTYPVILKKASPLHNTKQNDLKQ